MKDRIGWIVLALLFLAGCQSISYAANCNNRTDSNVSRCEINFSELSGVWSRDVNVSFVADSAESLPINLRASVGQGTVRVTYLNAQGDEVRHEFSPDAPLTVSDTVQVRADQAQVTFTSLHLTATHLEAVVEVGPGS